MSNDINQGVSEKSKDWKRKLAGDRNDNPLLNLSKSGKARVDVFTTPSILFKNLAEDTSEGVAIKDLRTEPTDTELIKLLKKLRSEANSTLNEKGFNNLFLVLGTLKWFDIRNSQNQQEEESFISPLLLIPVKLGKKGNPPEYTLLATDEEITVNFLVANKLRDEFDIVLPENEKIQELGYEGFVDAVRNSISNKQGWELEETACITLFESVKTAMIKDIEQNQEKIRNHSILRGLALQEPVDNPIQIEIIEDTKLDTINPELIYQIRDADSSQQVVIEAAKAGLSFVILGPPGTGKSQSIGNIIAELIALGKKVALVAQKQTALEAVYKIFSSKESNLEELCLNLHHQGTKNVKEFITELSKTKDLLSQRNQEFDSQNVRSNICFQQLDECRQFLNNYTAILHQKYQPINKSAFELFGELLKMEREKVPLLKFNIYNLQDWSEERLLLQAQNLIKDLGQFEEFFRGKQKTNIWSNSPIKKWDSDVSNNLRENINNLQKGVELATSLAIRLQELLNIANPNTLVALNKLQPAVTHIIAAPNRVPKGCPQGRNLNNLEKLFDKLKNDFNQFKNLGTELNPKYIQEFFNWDLLQLRDVSREFKKYNGIFRCLRKGFRRIRRRLIALRQDNNRVKYKELTADIEQAIERKKIQNKFAEDNQQDYYRNFESFYDGGMPNLEAIEDGLNWLKDLQKYRISPQAVAGVIYSNDNIQELRNLLENLDSSINLIQEGFKFMKKHFPQHRITKANEWEKTNFNEVKNIIKDIEQELPLFQKSLDCKQKEEELEAIGAKDFLSKLRQSKISPQHWFAILQKGVYKNWLEYIRSENYELRNFDENRYQQKIEEFSQLDTQQYQIAVKRLQQLHSTRWQEWSAQPEAKQQIQLLEKQNTF